MVEHRGRERRREPERNHSIDEGAARHASAFDLADQVAQSLLIHAGFPDAVASRRLGQCRLHQSRDRREEAALQLDAG
jgi:hypothetical protein